MSDDLIAAYPISTDPQVIFDTVARHLLTMDGPSRLEDDSDKCAYRGAAGRKCAIGVLIPDQRYNPSFEGKAVDQLVASGKFPEFVTKVNFLTRLQRIHDGQECWNVASIRESLTLVARDFCLNDAVLRAAD